MTWGRHPRSHGAVRHISDSIVIAGRRAQSTVSKDEDRNLAALYPSYALTPMPNRCGDRCCNMNGLYRGGFEIAIEGDCEIDELLRLQGNQDLEGHRFSKPIAKRAVTVMA